MANPNAPTSVNSVTQSYDDNGNLKYNGTSRYAWDFRNRLTSANIGGATTTYAYDHENQRVKMFENGTSTIFANQFYSKQGATTTKYIFANNQLVATVEKTPSTTTIAYIHTDNLSGTSAATNDHGEVIQDTDYYPFGN